MVGEPAATTGGFVGEASVNNMVGAEVEGAAEGAIDGAYEGEETGRFVGDATGVVTL